MPEKEKNQIDFINNLFDKLYDETKIGSKLYDSANKDKQEPARDLDS